MKNTQNVTSIQRYQKYELIFIKFCWFILALGLVMLLYGLFFNAGSYKTEKLIFGMLFLACGLGYVLLKHHFTKNGILFSRESLYYVSRALEIFAIAYVSIYLYESYWVNLLFVFPVLITCLSKGGRAGMILVAVSFILRLSLELVHNNIMPVIPDELIEDNIAADFMELLFCYFLLAFLTVICGIIFKDNAKSEEENRRLIEQLSEKYDMLAVAQDEIKFHYEKLKLTNNKLEDTNKRLTDSVAEFYTLQQVSQAISSIFDINELLKSVNDIILGVMGANNSTIILFDESKNRLSVHTTNISGTENLSVLNDNINCITLIKVLNSGKPILENFVESKEFVFTEGRDVNSLICVPLSTKSKKYGIVLIEQKYNNAFDEENVRLLGIIGQQVSIAIENAELYQKMHELATVDSLTGVFNRLCFQERLEEEFEKATKQGYPLSLAIFDIDHFKRFNDTFGHLFGDKVLKSIANMVKSELRKNDILARFGGEEFIILFPRTSLSDAYNKVEALRNKISCMSVRDTLDTAAVTVSFGVSSFSECAATHSELIRTADDALYEAKNSGRNCVKTATELYLPADDNIQISIDNLI